MKTWRTNSTQGNFQGNGPGGTGWRLGEGELEVWRHACVNARGVELANKDGQI